VTELAADCSQCVALCCVVPAFQRSADFAIDKPAGRPCPNLAADRCQIHDRLRPAGFSGCAVYDCFGAGQRLTARLAGAHWRDSPGVLDDVRRGLPVVRLLHELLWYVRAALELDLPPALRSALAAAASEVDAAAGDPVTELVTAESVRAAVNPLLQRASEHARARWPGARDLRGADLVGADLRRADLRGASLRGARLVGADLRGSRLTEADVTGADLRGADVRGVDLTGVLFLTRQQLAAVRADRATSAPRWSERPAHWD
jgi:hypothetical protein